MPDTDITREARELCERATPGKWYYIDAAFIARSRTLILELLDLLAAKDTEIARLTAERTAMLNNAGDIDCDSCKHNGIGDCEDIDHDCRTCAQDCPCKPCDGTSKWEWRGAKANNQGGKP